MEDIKQYAHYERYFFTINSLPNNKGEVFNYRVSLRQRMRISEARAHPPVVVELEGGPSPFVISVQNDNDPLTPIRTSSARISFVDDIDLGELLPSDAKEWKVVLTRLNDSVDVFTGYLTAEVYTQPAVAGPNIVTINAASPMVPTCATTMLLQGVGMITIGELLARAVAVTGDIRTVYMPAMFSLKDSADAADYIDILNWKFPSSPYARDVNTLTPVEDKYSPYSEPLMAICTLFGWSMVDIGDGALYFTSPAFTGKYMSIPVDSLRGGDYTLVEPTVESIEVLPPVDNADTVEIQQGYRAATLTVSAKSQEIALPSLEGSVVEQEFSRETVEVTTSSLQVRQTAECAGIRAEIRDSRIEMPRYLLELVNGSPEWRRLTPKEEEEWEDRWNNPGTWPTWTDLEDMEYLAGAHYRKIDWVSPDSLKPDAEQPKRSWKLEEALMIVDAAWYVSSRTNEKFMLRLPEDYCVFRANINGCFIPRGALVIDFSLMASPVDGFYLSEDGRFEGGDIEDYVSWLGKTSSQLASDVYWTSEKKIKFSLKIADCYYNGSAWVEEFATFEIPVEIEKAVWHNVVSNKTVDLLYEGDSGFYIPITEPMAGDAELCIYPTFYPFGGASPYQGTAPRSFIKGLSLSFAELIENYIENENDLTFVRDFGKSYTEKLEKSLTLHSKVNVAEQSTVLYDGTGVMIDAVYRTSVAEAQKPEQHLLDEYQRVYGRALRRWRRGTWLRDLQPTAAFLREGALLTATGYTADVEENVVEVYLSDVESVNIARYVE